MGDPNLIEMYSQNKRLYDSLKTSVKHRLNIINTEERMKELDAQRLATQSHQNRKIRLLDEIIHDVRKAYDAAVREGNKQDAAVLLRRLKAHNNERDEYLQKLQEQKDAEEELKKKKKIDPEEEEEDPEEEDPEEEDPEEEEDKPEETIEDPQEGEGSEKEDPEKKKKKKEQEK